MRIEEEIKLDYSDVLFRPKRSTLKSRSEVDLCQNIGLTCMSNLQCNGPKAASHIAPRTHPEPKNQADSWSD